MVDEKELQEKEYYRRRLAQWRELGFDVRELEAILETDFEHFKNMSMEKLKQQLHLMSSEEAIPKPRSDQADRAAQKDEGRLDRPIITEYDDIRKQNQEEKDDHLFEIRKEMLRRRRLEEIGVRDLEDDTEFDPSRKRRADLPRKPPAREPQIEEDYPLISFKNPVDDKPSRRPSSDKGGRSDGPDGEAHQELTLLEEEAALIKRKRRLLEEEEERLRRKRRLLLGTTTQGQGTDAEGTAEEPGEDEPALIFVGKGRKGTQSDEDEGQDEEEPAREDDHVRLKVAHGAVTDSSEEEEDDEQTPGKEEEAQEVEEVEEEEEGPTPRRISKRPVKKVRPVHTAATKEARQNQVSKQTPKRPAKRPKPVRPIGRKREQHTPRPVVILGVIMLFFTILVLFYLTVPFPVLTVKASASDENVSIGEYVTFYGNGSKSNGRITSYTWDFGDKSPTAKGKVVKHIYTKAGSYNATLTVKSDNGQKKSTKVLIRVSQLSVRPPSKMIGDIAQYTVNGNGFVEGDNLYSMKNPYSQIGLPAEIKIQNVSLSYNGTMASSVDDITIAEDGFNETHQVLHREVSEDLEFKGVAYTNLGNMPVEVEGTENMKQQVYQDLKTNHTVKTTISSTAQTKPIKIGSFPIESFHSKDDLRTYPDLATVNNQVSIEDLFVGKNLDTSDPSTLQGQIEKGQSPNAIIYSWKFDGIDNIYKRPAIHLNVTVDANTLARLGMTSLYVDVWVANSIPTYVKMHTHFTGGNATTSYRADNTAEMTAFTAGAAEITGTCGAQHYRVVHPLAIYGEFNMTPPEGDPNRTSHMFTPHQALVEALDQSSMFRSFMGTGSPYAVAGNYSEQAGPTWNITFGKKGSETGYTIIVTDIGNGEYRVLANQVKIDVPEVSRDDLLSLVTLSSTESIFKNDDQIKGEMFVGNNIDYDTTSLILDTETLYPNLDLTFTSISATKIKYTYSLTKQVPDPGPPAGQKMVTVSVNADNGQVMFIQVHSGNLPFLFKMP